MKKETKIGIKGMHCAACSQGAQRQLCKMEGMEKAEVFLTTESANLVYDDTLVNEDKLKTVLKKAGFELSEVQDTVQSLKDDKVYQNYKKRMFSALGFSIVLMIVSMGPMINLFSYPTMVSYQISVLVQLILALGAMACGYHFYQKGLPALFRLNPNMDSLVALGTLASFFYSLTYTIILFINPSRSYHFYYEGVAMIIALVMLGKTMEKKSKSKTSRAIEELINLTPQQALVIRDGKEILLPIEQLYLGEVIRVKPGERLAVDGIVTKGSSSVDESMLTGESIPVTKVEGDLVYAGTINQRGSLTYTATAIGRDTALGNIIKLVRDAQNTKAPIARLADKVSSYFVPSVIAISIITFIGWLLGGSSISQSLTFAVATLVIACPCALGLATPIAIMVSSGKAATLGILFKKASSIEELNKVDTVVFDKTGTITYGKPIVTNTHFSIVEKGDFLDAIYSSERLSEHPLANTLVKHLQDMDCKEIEVDSFTSVPGKGIESTIGENTYYIGSSTYIKNITNKLIFEDEALKYKKEGKTILYATINNECVAMFALKDTSRAEAKDVISQLREKNIQTILLTGDNKINAEAIAKEVGISKVIAQVLPNEKADHIKALQTEGHIVAMVGDGVNDAPPLAQSDISITVASGSDIAIETSDVVLMSSNLDHLITAINLSSKTLRNIKQNLFWAFGYNVIGIPIAAGLLTLFGGPSLNPAIAALAMSLSSVSVVSNSLRLYRFHA